QLLMLDLYPRYVMHWGGRLFDLQSKLKRDILGSATPNEHGLRHVGPPFRMLFMLIGLLLKKNPHANYYDEIGRHTAAVDELLQYLSAETNLADDDQRALRSALLDGAQPSDEVIGRFVRAIAVELPRWRTRIDWALKY